MRFSDPATVAGAFVARVTQDAAGADVRALIGGATPRVIKAEDVEAGAASLPARPFLAFAFGPVPDNGAFDQHTAQWWIYDDLSQGHPRIGALCKALARAYDVGLGAAPLSVGPAFPGALTEPRIDRALGLRGRRFDFTINA